MPVKEDPSDILEVALTDQSYQVCVYHIFLDLTTVLMVSVKQMAHNSGYCLVLDPLKRLEISFIWARASPIVFEVLYLFYGPFYFQNYKLNNKNTQDRTPLKLLCLYLLNQIRSIYYKNNGQKVIKCKL